MKDDCFSILVLEMTTLSDLDLSFKITRVKKQVPLMNIDWYADFESDSGAVLFCISSTDNFQQ